MKRVLVKSLFTHTGPKEREVSEGWWTVIEILKTDGAKVADTEMFFVFLSFFFFKPSLESNMGLEFMIPKTDLS